MRPVNCDFIGRSLLVLALVCWEVMLSKGQEWDWLSDVFGRVQVLATLFVLGAAGLVFWETRQSSPIVDFRPMRERNFALPCVIFFCSFAVLYVTRTLLPRLLKPLFAYAACQPGLVLSPSC